MAKRIIFTVVLVLIGCGSFSFGLLSCRTVNNQQAAEPKAAQAASGAQTDPASQEKPQIRPVAGAIGFVTSLLMPNMNAEKGLQKKLADKSEQVLGVWATLKVTNGVVNILQSSQAAGSESLSPNDYIMKKLSNMLSNAYSVILFLKILLAVSGYMVFLAVIPICAIITIITIWTYKDRQRVHKIVITAVLISLIVPFAIPAAFQMSSLMDRYLLSKNVNTLVDAIEIKGKTASAMEINVSAARRQGNSVVSYIGNARNLSNALIEDVTNYLIIFIFVYCITPVLFLLVLFFLARYFIKLILR